MTVKHSASLVVIVGLLSLGVMIGCGTSSNTGRTGGGMNGGGSGGVGPGGTSGSPPPGPFLFVGNQEGSVLELGVDSTTGAAGNPNGSATSVGAPAHAVAGTPNGKFVYVATDNGIAAFSIGSSGALTQIAGSPFAIPGSKPTDIAVDANGNNVYVVFNGSNQVSSYHIQTDGSLGQPNTAPTGTNPLSIATDSSGNFIYVANNGSNDISAFSVAATGALMPVPGSPFNAAPDASPTTGPGPIAAAGKFLYVSSDGFIVGYSIDSSNGALTQIPTIATTSPSQTSNFPDSTVIIAPHGMVADPNGSFLVTSNLPSDTSLTFTQIITINTANGQLTSAATVQGADSTATVSPLAIDGQGQHVYGIGLADTSCFTSCARAVDSFAVSSSTISTIGSPISTGLQGSDSIAVSPF